MTTMAKSSPLLKILGIGALVAVFLIIFHYSVREKATVEPISEVPKLPEDLDETSETIRTLSAQITQLRSEIQSVSEQNQTLQKESEQFKEKIARQEEEKVKEVVEQNTRADSLVDQIAGRFDEAWQQAPTSDAKPQGGEEVVQPLVQPGSKWVWIMPLGQEGGSSSMVQPTIQPTTANVLSTTQDFTTQKVSVSETPKTEQTVAPVHTIPANATLIDSTMMTALIGKVPLGDTISDPFPFKVLFGAENLASNGIKIPGVVGMVASGMTKGDWTLSCVRGDVTSMTFTFEDGTIHTVKDKGNLGYLSDPMGVPCVGGQRISNASNYLAGRVAAAAAEGVADSFARAARDEQVGLFGGRATQVRKPGQLAFSSMAKEASGELQEYLEERLAQTFDAIYVAPGAKVAIHIQEEVPIDFNPTGRKVFHGDIQSASIHNRLD